MIIVCVHCERQIADDEIPDGKVSVGICERCREEYEEAHPVDKAGSVCYDVGASTCTGDAL